MMQTRRRNTTCFVLQPKFVATATATAVAMMVAVYCHHISPVSAYLPPSCSTRTATRSTTFSSFWKPVPREQRQQQPQRRHLSLTPLYLHVPQAFASASSQAPPTIKTTSTASTTSTTSSTTRLSHEEQNELLRHVVELRRIQKIYQDLSDDGQLGLSSSSFSSHSSVSILFSLSSSSSSSSTSSSDSSRLLAMQQQQLSHATGYGDEIELLQQAVEQGQEARQQLITTNMGLVHHAVQAILGRSNSSGGKQNLQQMHQGVSSGGADNNKNSNYNNNNNNGFLQSLSREDLIQEGAIGLAKAVDRWDPEIGGKFSSYAYYWIRSSILRGIAQRDNVMKIPEYLQGHVMKVQRAARNLGVADLLLLSLDDDTTTTNDKNDVSSLLAQEAGLTSKQVQQALQIYQRRRHGILSFESWMEKGQDLSSETHESLCVSARGSSATLTSSSSSSTSTAASATTNNALGDLQAMLSKFLRPKELEALSWRYGLLQDDGGSSSGSSGAAATTITTNKNKRKGRDYLAEAEEKLFGASSSSSSSVRTAQKQKQQPTTRSLSPGSLATTTTKPPLAPPTQGKWGEAMSFVEVGKRMQVSAEYGRRLCHSALAKLRRAAQEGALVVEPAMQ